MPEIVRLKQEPLRLETKEGLLEILFLMSGEWFSPPPCEGTMAKSHLTALDAEIIRSAFLSEIHDSKTPESQWRDVATKLIQTYTGQKEVDPDMLSWIIRK